MSSPTLLSIPTAAEELTGKRPSPPTCWRWVHRGRNGIKLRAVFVMGAWRTTREDFLKFVEACSAVKRQAQDVSTSMADEQLAAAGIL
ncbi:hypothetical protein Pan44_28050 [Caulifigura coniformis]|uniref:Uncharacterized protein n=1 Tax=Caulifigura coniformis TaxID=2527983 RepID=A0A517SF82_9PLAN|nr:helix-turn-helix domain-containing protein [Caulifigura coniformis]QDT54768.1 hypothetical protein Pan44_28050 [Caulifigura coniformis]